MNVFVGQLHSQTEASEWKKGDLNPGPLQQNDFSKQETWNNKDKKIGSTEAYFKYLSKINDVSKIKKGVDVLISFRNLIPAVYRPYVDPSFKEGFEALSAAKGKETEDYIKSVFK